MGYQDNRPFSQARFRKRLVVTATGDADLVVCPASTAIGTDNRLVVTGYSIIGHNTNAAATVFVLRNKETAAAVILGGSMGPTTGSVSSGGSCLTLPSIAGETIELSVTGALTGRLDVMVEGYIVPASHSMAQEYTGIP